MHPIAQYKLQTCTEITKTSKNLQGGAMASRDQLTSWRRAMTQQGSKMSFFGGNVFATPVGQKIGKYTLPYTLQHPLYTPRASMNTPGTRGEDKIQEKYWGGEIICLESWCRLLVIFLMSRFPKFSSFLSVVTPRGGLHCVLLVM